MLKRSLIFFISFFLTALGFAQTQVIDSLIKLSDNTTVDSVKVKLYGDISWELMAVDITKALEYAEKQLVLATEIRNEGLIAQAESDLGNVLNRKSDYPNALVHYFKAVVLRQKLKQPVKVAGIYSNIATVYMRQNKYKDAIGINFKSLKIFEEVGDKAKQSLILGNVGNIYYELEQNKEAIIYYRRGLQLAKESGNASSEANILLNIGGIKFEEKEIDSTLYYFAECEKIMLANNLMYGLGALYNDVGKAYTYNKDYTKAISYYDKSLKNRIEFQDEHGIGLSHVNLGELFAKLNDHTKAITHLEQAAEIFKRTHSLINLKDAYQHMAYAHEQKGDLTSALKYYQLYTQYKDSVYTQQASDQLVEMNTKYETDKKEKENQLLNTQNQLSEETIKQQKTFSYFIITALILAAGLAFFIFRGLKQQRKANRIISKQKKDVEHKNHIIEEKQKEIVDSINYARRIQYALLAHDEFLNEQLPGHFVLFKPKDIVSGDFYWAANAQNKNGDELFYLACCDSTGHGVPGAFMSLLSIGFLSEAIKEKDIFEPNKVFNYVRKRLVDSISREHQKDGFDGILMCFNKTQNTITYAAANNKPLLVVNNSAIELPCDKMPVGEGQRNEEFNLYQVNSKKGDTIYLYTDGYADQFGGPKGKKFKYKPLEDMLMQNAIKPVNEQKNILDSTIEQWKGNLEQVDDILVIGVNV